MVKQPVIKGSVHRNQDIVFVVVFLVGGGGVSDLKLRALPRVQMYLAKRRNC